MIDTLWHNVLSIMYVNCIYASFSIRSMIATSNHISDVSKESSSFNLARKAVRSLDQSYSRHVITRFHKRAELKIDHTRYQQPFTIAPSQVIQILIYNESGGSPQVLQVQFGNNVKLFRQTQIQR